MIVATRVQTDSNPGKPSNRKDPDDTAHIQRQRSSLAGSNPGTVANDDPGNFRSRRTFLSVLGTGALVGSVRPATGSTMDLRVRVYPATRLGWSPLTHSLRSEVRRALGQLHRVLRDRQDRDLALSVEAAQPVPQTDLNVNTQRTLYQSFRSWLEDTDAPTGPICHLLFVDEPFNTDIGYGGANATITGGGTFGAQATVNVGATEFWDDRTVTRNMAIHETLHTIITPGAAEAVNGTRCEHDLGAVASDKLGRVVVTPIATSYADTTSLGGETRWHGTGCYTHSKFSRYDHHPDLDTTWHHTPQLSQATVDASLRSLSQV